MFNRSNTRPRGIRDAARSVTMCGDRPPRSLRCLDDADQARQIELAIPRTTIRSKDAAGRHHLDPIASGFDLKTDHSVDLEARRDGAAPEIAMTAGRRDRLPTAQKPGADLLTRIDLRAQSVLPVPPTTTIARRRDSRKEHRTRARLHRLEKRALWHR